MPKKTKGQATQTIVQAAQGQREKPTAAEDRLWRFLRNRRLGGLKFRRQHPYGSYVLDLFCVERLLVVEIDGGIHDDPVQAATDVRRTEYLTDCGLRVLRVRNEDVSANLPGVLRKILAVANQYRSTESALGGAIRPNESIPSPECRPQATSGEGEGEAASYREVFP